ncbi:MAG TPA: 50S ribosomal protein L11 methyltransferase [Gemmatimonadaceae bacterium]
MSRSAPIDWESWRPAVAAHRVGSLTVMPPWLAADPGSQLAVVIDPAMAFGTGEHATTRGCLSLLQTANPSGKRVADLGTGSGVLAIAAAKLGAVRIVAIEIDPDAIPNARANVVLNGVADRVTIIEGDAAPILLLLRPFDLIVANILSTVIRELFDQIADSLSPSGAAILSGILDEESADMKEFLAGRGWIIASEITEDRWWSALIARQ